MVNKLKGYKLLRCLYNPLFESPEVVPESEVEQMLATGVWFRTPGEAKKFKEDALNKVLNPPKSESKKVEKLNEGAKKNG